MQTNPKIKIFIVIQTRLQPIHDGHRPLSLFSLLE
jgi:hypothetical protein